MNIWKITYKREENKEFKEKQETIFYKIDAVGRYINILSDRSIDVSELKILKNGQDYTETLNRFLYK